MWAPSIKLARLLPCALRASGPRYLSADADSARRETIRGILSLGPSPQLFRLYGWARKVIRQKVTSFVHLDDGSGTRLQVVVGNHLIADKLHNGAALECVGRLVASTGPMQQSELLCESVRVVGDCDPKTYWIGHLGAEYRAEYLRERPHLRPRVQYFQSVARVRSGLITAIHIFMKQSEFVAVHTPLITAHDCEGGGECFTLQPLHWPDAHRKQYFGRPVYLTVSGQLHLEALASSLSRVYTLSPVFRAEKSMSPKHLSEFYMLEAEECFLFRLDSLLDRVEALCKFLIFYIRNHCGQDLDYLLARSECPSLEQVSAHRFVRMTYQEALQVLHRTGQFGDILEAQPELNPSMERAILAHTANVPTFLTHFPRGHKPFYMKSDPEDRALCFDLLLPVCGEVCGGSLREDRLDRLEANMQSGNLAESLDWYLDLRRFGHAPSGGFGLGLDRFVQSLAGVANIKDVVTFPRWPYHCRL